ncbi:MAG: hypothetical protein H0T86_09960, partial [Gemmatimonadales bacterium]|nr:hypothetical protein [Gemmatimonadales bacterium]
TAYREVAAAIAAGERFEAPTPGRIVARRSSTGGVGNLGLDLVRARLRRGRGWQTRERRRFDRAMVKLAGRGAARSPGRRLPVRKRPARRTRPSPRP